jgi:hypothetical protein
MLGFASLTSTAPPPMGRPVKVNSIYRTQFTPPVPQPLPCEEKRLPKVLLIELFDVNGCCLLS